MSRRLSGEVRSDHYEFRCLRKNGTIIYLEVLGTVIDYGGHAAILGNVVDVTERRRAEMSMRQSEKNYRIIVDNTYDWEFWANPEGQFIYSSPSCERITGFTADEYISDANLVGRIVHEDDKQAYESHCVQERVSPATSNLEFRIIHKDGSPHWIEHICQPVYDPDGKFMGTRGSNRDITNRKQVEDALKQAHEHLQSHVIEIESLQEQLREQAIRDPLTGLFNRRYLQETFDREIARANRENKPIGLVIMDIDHFKKVNDAYGHRAGDKVLKSLGELLIANIRAGDIPCRYGGEEFVIVMPGAILDVAHERAELLRIKFEAMRVPYGGQELLATMSFGVAAYPIHGLHGDAILIRADRALYRAKQSGRNCVVSYQDTGRMPPL
jgi:diguanylate cyclase (GGDEF)-like protein/PAS domain S-box-containing protein